MSYIQIEIGGKLRGLKFNQLAHAEYMVIAAGSKNEILHSYALIYAGLYANCIAKREEPGFTFEDVCDWVDKVTDGNIFVDILKVYKETLPPVEDVKKKTPVKKKLQPKNTKRNALK